MFLVYFMIVVLAAYLFYLVWEKRKDSFEYRMKQLDKQTIESEIETKNKLIRMSGFHNEHSKDDIEEIIRKITNKESVDIPLPVFDYIYRNLNKFAIFDREGNISFVEYEKFKSVIDEKNLFEEDKQKEKDIEQLIKESKNTEARTIHVKLPSGVEYITDTKNNKTTVFKPEEDDENKNKKQNEKIIQESQIIKEIKSTVDLLNKEVIDLNQAIKTSKKN